MKTFLACLLALAAATPGLAQTQSAQAGGTATAAKAEAGNGLSLLDFLVGDWIAEESPGVPNGMFTLNPDLGGNIMVRRNQTRTPRGIHEDFMIIYRLGGGLRALYTDNEGHAINYSLAALASPLDRPGVVFLSDEIPGTPRFRLTYVMNADSTLKIDFEIAPPGGAFNVYLSGTARRRP